MVSRKMWPSLLMVMAFVFGFARLGVLALALGKFTFRPCTEAVHMRMKMTSRTYARSSIGVMLMSSYGLSSLTCMRGKGQGLVRRSSAVVLGHTGHELV